MGLVNLGNGAISAFGERHSTDTGWRRPCSCLFTPASADSFSRAKCRKPCREQRQAGAFLDGNHNTCIAWDRQGQPYEDQSHKKSYFFEHPPRWTMSISCASIASRLIRLVDRFGNASCVAAVDERRHS